MHLCTSVEYKQYLLRGSKIFNVHIIVYNYNQNNPKYDDSVWRKIDHNSLKAIITQGVKRSV